MKRLCVVSLFLMLFYVTVLLGAYENDVVNRSVLPIIKSSLRDDFWDFETGWQGWTHTNGQPYPAGWDVVWSGTNPPPPFAGDSMMGIGECSDSALSPVVIPPANMSLLKYGYYNFGGSGSWINELHIGIKYFTGGVWNVVELQVYPTGVVSGPAWDSVDISGYATSDSVQIYFYYTDLGTWGYNASFDNVGLYALLDHDVGCVAVTSPPGGWVAYGDYDVIGQIHNFGVSTETFDVTAHVFDTTAGAWTLIFNQTVTLTDFPIGGDSLVNFGMVTFAADNYYYTEIFTLLADDNPANDTAFVYSWTALTPGDVIFELDAEAATGDIRLLGVEFDGTYFYCTGARNYDTCFVYVIDTTGVMIWAMKQPDYCHGTWGWRDLAWDGVYAGPDRIDTLYASVNNYVDKFGIDLTTGTLTNYGSFLGPLSPNRALAYDEDDNWFFTASWLSNCYKFDKTNSNIQQVGNPGYEIYGAAYDNAPYGPWVWWHSQDDPGTGFQLQIEQMESFAMTWTGVILAPVVTMSATGVAGGLCYWSNFRGMDVLFGMNQGTPDHIYGVFLGYLCGVEEEPIKETTIVFGLNKIAPNPVRDRATVTYTTTRKGSVTLKIYDCAGRLVKTLIDRKITSAGGKTVYWDGRDNNNRPVAAGVYFFRLQAEDRTATKKMVVVR